MNRLLDTAAGIETHAWLVDIRMQDAEHAARLHRSIREIRRTARTSDGSRLLSWRSILGRLRAPVAHS